MDKNLAFKTESLKLSSRQKSTFTEFLNYKLNSNRLLGYRDFTKHCGISRQQWDLFRAENRDRKVKWLID